MYPKDSLLSHTHFKFSMENMDKEEPFDSTKTCNSTRQDKGAPSQEQKQGFQGYNQQDLFISMTTVCGIFSFLPLFT